MEVLHGGRAKTPFYIESMGEDDLDAVNTMRMQSWRDTYPNKELGITLEWVNQQLSEQTSNEVQAARRQEFIDSMKHNRSTGWVAKDKNGEVVGAAIPYIDDRGLQHVGSIYVDQQWHGTGIGGELMQRVIDWFDPTRPIELEVAAYNQRAIRFYEKWGFEKVADSERMHRKIMPVVKMIRKEML